MKENPNIPPIVSDLIQIVNNGKESLNHRHNVAMRLMAISEAAQKAVDRFNESLEKGRRR